MTWFKNYNQPCLNLRIKCLMIHLCSFHVAHKALKIKHKDNIKIFNYATTTNTSISCSFINTNCELVLVLYRKFMFMNTTWSWRTPNTFCFKWSSIHCIHANCVNIAITITLFFSYHQFNFYHHTWKAIHGRESSWS